MIPLDSQSNSFFHIVRACESQIISGKVPKRQNDPLSLVNCQFLQFFRMVSKKYPPVIFEIITTASCITLRQLQLVSIKLEHLFIVNVIEKFRIGLAVNERYHAVCVFVLIHLDGTLRLVEPLGEDTIFKVL